MALQEMAYPIKFAGGLETKSDPKAVPTARLLTLENAVFTKAVSLSKRYGYTSLGLSVLGSATPYALPRGLAARGDELVLFTEAAAYSYVEGAGAWSQIADGMMSIRQSDRALVKTVSSQTGCDYASCDGVAVVAWNDSRGGVWFAVTETNGERVTIPPTQASATGTNPRCVRSGDRLLILWAQQALGQIRCILIDPAAPHAYDAGTFPRIIVDDLSTTLPNYDAAYVNATNTSGTDAAAIVWLSSLNTIRSGWLIPSGQVGSPGTGWPSVVTHTPSPAALPLTAGPVIAPSPTTGDDWALAWSGGGDSYGAIVQSDFGAMAVSVEMAETSTTTSGGDRIAVAFRGSATSGTINIWSEARNATLRNSRVYNQVITVTAGVGSASDGSPDAFAGACLASCGWVDEPDGGTARAYVTLLHPAALFATYVTVRDDGLPIAQSIPSNAGLPPGHMLPRVTAGESDRTYDWCAVYRAQLPVDDGVNTNDVFAEAGPRLVSLDFDASDSHQAVYVGRTLYVGGAVTWAYDGVGFVEAAPFYAPDWETGATLHTNSTAGTGGMANGTYSYLFWYEATLANGEIVRGPTSKPYSVTVGGSDDRVTITIPALRLTCWGLNRREELRVCAARSLAGDTSAYYRITSLDPSTAGTANGYVANGRAADTVTVIDEYSDATLATREPHYTTGGVPSNDPIAASGVIAEGKGRVFWADASDPSGVYYSQERADGYAIEATPELRLQVPPAGGAVTGIAVMDDAVMIFKRSAIYMVTGAGPLANPAAGGEWSTPALITSDVGCVDQRSLATIPTGLVFQSAKGIYQLDRGRQVSYVGAPVEAYNAQRIVRATLVEDTTQVRFLTDSGSTLLYDYLFGQWSTFTNHEGIDSITARGLYHYLRTDGRVFRQATTYADDNLPIPMVIETAWIRFGEARQGLQRIWHAQILGERKSAHELRVQWQTDYDEPGNWSEPVVFDATSTDGSVYGDGSYGSGVYGGDAPSRYEWTAHVGRRCEAIRFRFTFPEPSGAFGACAELTELLITGGVKGNRNKLPAARMG